MRSTICFPPSEDLPTWLGIDIPDKRWLDGSQVYYTNWDKGEGQEGCGVANFGNGGLWYTTECNNDFVRSLCEVPQGAFDSLIIGNGFYEW